jgi:ribulose-phosphate 3-epimerase
MKIVPAILAEKIEDFLLRLRQAESFTNYVQIDIMDGIFVPSQSFSEEKINGINTSLSFEIHLMVNDPFGYMSRINNSHLKKVIFHFESDVNHIDFINHMKGRGITAGMAIKPETEIEEFEEIAAYVDTVMFLTVDPCCYGHPFMPDVLKKIEKARRIFADKTIAADGGVSLENLQSFFDMGVDYVCVGSRIFLNSSPGENYNQFIKKIAELEAIKSVNK